MSAAKSTAKQTRLREYTARGRQMKRTSRVGMKREAVIDPVIEKPLLRLHGAMNVGAFWRAVHQLLAAAIPNRLIGIALQQNPVLPMIVRWTRPMPDGFFTAEPLKNYIAGRPRHRFVRISHLFSNRSSLIKSAFHRRYMARQRCLYVVCLFFWRNQRPICVIAIMRTAMQGDFLPAEMKLLRELYPQFLTAHHRLGTLDREHSVRVDLEEFLRRLRLPTILLRWNLKPIYLNRAARDFCAVWEKGPESARLMKATSPIPSEILDRCHLLKQQWAQAQRPIAPQTGFKEERVHHPRSPHLRATLQLKQLSSCGVAQPHFFIECEDLRRDAARSTGPAASARLPHPVRLTRREQEVARLVCEGRSNQEIADESCLSLPMVKKHLHSIFRKLEVTSRSQLIALLR